MATNDGLEPKRSDEPWRSQAKAAGESGSSIKPAQGGSTVSYVGGTLAQTSGQMGMPTEFGRYRVRKQLGGGGMGAVYLVENTELKRDEALKVPHFGVGDDPEMRERFLREARAAAQLDHPNFCPVHDVGEINGVCFLTMRYLKGKLLSDYTGKTQPPRKAVEITAKLAQALESAHARGVIHRDLKPNNVMMCAGVGPVVMDFGLAKQTKSEDQKLTQEGTTLGTPSYMPPEQVKGELDRMGPASDVYSLGVILFEMLTGRLPFKAATTVEVYGKILHTDAPAPSSLRPELNPALDAICAKAMAKKPEGRYPSMKAFAATLIDFLKTAPTTEGAGNLTPMKATPADIFQAATVAPNQPAWRQGPRGETMQRGSQAPLRVPEPVRKKSVRPETDISEPEIFEALPVNEEAARKQPVAKNRVSEQDLTRNRRDEDEEKRKACPMCGEMILANAVKCRFCDEIFDQSLRRAAGRKRSKKSSAGRVCSILSIICGSIAFLFCPPLFGIAGVTLGIVGLRKSKSKTLGVVGIVVSVVGTIIGMILSAMIFMMH